LQRKGNRNEKNRHLILLKGKMSALAPAAPRGAAGQGLLAKQFANYFAIIVFHPLAVFHPWVIVF